MTVPLETLTKFAGFAVSPKNVFEDEELEYFINRRVSQANIDTQKQSGFDVGVGSKVLVYNDISPMDKRRSQTRSEVFIITGHNHGRYYLNGVVSGVEIVLRRFKIRTIEK